jgi:hypothetical protein
MSDGVAYRGVVYDGHVWAWPTVLWTHADAAMVLPWLGTDASCRWRQWNPGEAADFDKGSSDDDQALVNAWLACTSCEPGGDR